MKPFRAFLMLLAWAMILHADAQPAAIDSGFNPPLAPGSQVYAAALQTNGQIIIGGEFSNIGGTNIINVARLNPDGSLDASFNPGKVADVGYVTTLAIQSDGRILIGGSFASSTSLAPANLARLNADGSVDTNFDSTLYVDNAVNAVRVQPDGEILLAGAFFLVDGYLRRDVARLFSDGTLDVGFDACVAADAGNGASGMALLSDGYILVSGRFTFDTGDFRNGIARLIPSGNLDTNYAPQPGIEGGSTAFALATRSNGEALLAGNFRSYFGTYYGGLVQLTTDGVPDTSFDSVNGLNYFGTNFAITIQPNAQVLIGGNFTNYNGLPVNQLARINSDGSLDGSFDPGIGPDNSIGNIVIQRDRKILVVGKFTSFNGEPHIGMVRLNGDHSIPELGPPTQLNTGQLQLTLYGVDQTNYTIQASSDFTNWVAITNVVGNGDIVSFQDPTVNPPAIRFYRALAP